MHCTICAAMGQPERASSHNTEMCYMNPAARFFRAGLWRQRVAQLVREGKEVPNELHRDGYVDGKPVGG